MNALDVRLNLIRLHCFDEADGFGNAEPYLWTVFFKIDGETAVVDAGFHLQGTATVIGTKGNQRDLPDLSVSSGETVAIPAALGEFKTRLQPIPLQKPFGKITHTGGVMGLVAVLLEEDKTPNTAVAKGHDALNAGILDALNRLIPTLGILTPEPTPEQIEALKTKVRDAVLDRIRKDTGIVNWLVAGGNQDDLIGSEMFRFSHRQLEEGGVSGIPFSRRFKEHGDWEIS